MYRQADVLDFASRARLRILLSVLFRPLADPDAVVDGYCVYCRGMGEKCMQCHSNHTYSCSTDALNLNAEEARKLTGYPRAMIHVCLDCRQYWFTPVIGPSEAAG